MNEGLIPRRYAKALLKFADENKTASQVYDTMKTLTDSFAANTDLSQALGNPFVKTDAKRRLLMTAAGATAKDKTFADFVSLLLQNNRVDMTRDIAIAYQQLYRKARNIHSVDITTAAPLDKEQTARLKELIEKHLDGGTAEITTTVDPDLIGGFVVNIGSERLDASLQNELKQLRLKLLSK